jgi:hypothetical protein
LAEEVGNALGFKPVGKNQNPITDWRNRRQGEAWFGLFEHRVNGGTSPTAAIKGVADEVNSTAATVRRRLDEFAKCFGTTPLEMVQARQRLRDEEEAELQETERQTHARLAAILRGEPDPMASDEAD